MKASLKFRDESTQQRPLIRAKIPISILHLPFLTSVTAGDSSDLRLDLSTAFSSFPSFRLSYHPNNSFNPFTLSIKSGFANSALSMTAEFNLLNQNLRSSPSFMLRFNPMFGDFSFKKSVQSLPSKTSASVSSELEGWVEAAEFKKADLLGSKAYATIKDALTGGEVTAGSTLPIKNMCAAVKFKWGVKLPSDTGLLKNKMPMLVMRKISIEHVAGGDGEIKKKGDVGKGGGDEVAEAVKSLRMQMEGMRSAVEQLRGEVCGMGKLTIGSGDVAKGGGDVGRGGKRDREVKVDKGSGKEDVNEELRKALMGAAGGGK